MILDANEDILPTCRCMRIESIATTQYNHRPQTIVAVVVDFQRGWILPTQHFEGAIIDHMRMKGR